jgi:hypothetical protein
VLDVLVGVQGDAAAVAVVLWDIAGVGHGVEIDLRLGVAALWVGFDDEGRVAGPVAMGLVVLSGL